MEDKFKIKESLSGAFFVMSGNSPIGGFHSKENAEIFLSCLQNNKSDFDKGYEKGWNDATKIGITEAHKYQ